MATNSKARRVALVGAGNIAQAHLHGLRHCRGVRVAALCDPALERARDLAAAHRVPAVHGSVAQLIEAGEIDAAHVLVPPDRHLDVTRQLLAAGIPVLVEKPLALTAAEVEELREVAAGHGVVCGVNHSMLFFPVVQRLMRDLEAGVIGRLEHLTIVHNAPLRQLDSGEVSHFMFQSEANILLEQAVHPFSIVQRLLGRCEELTARAEPARALATGAPFRDTWSVAMRCERGTAMVFLAFGRSMPETTLHAIATDGAVRADLLRSQYVRMRKTRWLDFWDSAQNTMGAGIGLLRQGAGVAAAYGLGLFRLRKFPDAFLESIGASVADFHRAVRAGGQPPCTVDDAAQVAEMCERTAAAAAVSWTPHPRFAPPVEPPPAREGEVVVTGATGFLGRSLVEALLEAGRPVTALVRRPEFVGAHLRDPRVRVMVGDARDPAAVRMAMAGASYAVHLATCPPGPGERAEDSMAEGVRTVAEACIASRVRRLVFTSSAAALYLGDPKQRVIGASGTDNRPRQRGEYARGKIAAEQELARLVRESGLPAVVLRPAIVVGPGGPQNHSGVGLWVRDNQCVGWGIGSHPLPFVLARDCAQAILGSLSSTAAVGKSYNLAGDVRFSAAEYVALLGKRTGRRFEFHRQPIWSIVAIEWCKWLIKLAARRPRESPSRRDFASRGFHATLDCSDAAHDLSWQPESDRARFLDEAIPVAPAPAPAPPAPVSTQRPITIDAT